MSEITLPSWIKKVDSYTIENDVRVTDRKVNLPDSHQDTLAYLKYDLFYYAIEIDDGARGIYVTTEGKPYANLKHFINVTLGEDVTNLSTVKMRATKNKDDLVYDDMVPIIYVPYVVPNYVDSNEIGGLINIPDVEGLKYRITYEEIVDGIRKNITKTLPPGHYQLTESMIDPVIAVTSIDTSTYIIVEPHIKPLTMIVGKSWYHFGYKTEEDVMKFKSRVRLNVYDVSSGENVKIPPEEYPNFLKFKWGGPLDPEITNEDVFYRSPYPYGRRTAKVTILNDEYIFLEGLARVTKSVTRDNQQRYWFYDTGDGKKGEVEIRQWGVTDPRTGNPIYDKTFAAFDLYIKKGSFGERKEVVALPPREWGNNEIYMKPQEGIEYYNGITGSGETFEKTLIKVPDTDSVTPGSNYNIVYATDKPFVIAAKVNDPTKYRLKDPVEPPENWVDMDGDVNPYAKRAWEYIWDSIYRPGIRSSHVGTLFTFSFNNWDQAASNYSKYIAVWVNGIRIRPHWELSGNRSITVAIPRLKKNAIVIEFRDPGSFISSVYMKRSLLDSEQTYSVNVWRMTYGYRAVFKDTEQDSNHIFISVHGGKWYDKNGNLIYESFPNPGLVTPLPGYVGGSVGYPVGEPIPQPGDWNPVTGRPHGFDVPPIDLDDPDLEPPSYIDPYPDPYPEVEPEEPDVVIPPGVDDEIIPVDPVDPEAPEPPEPDPVYPVTPPPEGTDEPVAPAPPRYTRVTVTGNASVDVYDASTNKYLTTVASSVPRNILNGTRYIFRAYASQGFTFSGLGKYRQFGRVYSYQQLVNDHTRMRDLMLTPSGSLEFMFDTIRITENQPVDTIGINNVYLMDEDKTNELSFDIMVNKEATIIVDPRTKRAIKANLTDYIINLLQLPFTIPSENIIGEQPILLGLKSVMTTAPVINTDSITIDLGKVTVPSKYNNSYDYSNTAITMHLPYHNPVMLDANYVLGHDVGVKYIVNLYTGQTTINITSSFINDNVILSVSTMIGNNIAFIDPKIVRGVLNDNNIQPVLNNNTPSPMIEVTRNIPYQMDSQFNKDIRTTVEQLGSESGYIYVHDIDINIDTTLDELSTIKSTLASGIIIK